VRSMNDGQRHVSDGKTRAVFPRLVPLFLLICSQGLWADSFSFKGTFASDDQVQLFDLTLASDSTVAFQSLGYGGGTNAAGAVISTGGFDSYVTWYDATGTQIGTNDDGCGSANSDHGVCLDAYASVFLTTGSYTLALTESGNSPIGALSDGFTMQGAGNFTCPQGFCDLLGNQDSGSWAMDITGVASAATSTSPEPVSLALTICGLTLVALARRRRICLTDPHTAD
jgi:hypothetical protein